MKVCVQGLWHLGSVTGACLAAAGHDVVGFDSDYGAVSSLRDGKPPIFEPGLEELVTQAVASGKLRFATAAEELANDIEVLWVAYDTPVDENDVADAGFVLAQVEAVLPALPKGCTVLVSSQLPVGSVARLEEIARQICPEKSLTFACSPENLRLGKALDAFRNPDRVVVGVRTDRDRERIRQLLAPLTDRIEWMSVEAAEMTKHAINSFLATSVVFANEIATICEIVGADAKEVERGLKTEQRIGPKAYLSPGAAFAGGTLARDVEFLKAVSGPAELRIPLLESVKTSNDFHKGWTRRKLTALLPTLKGATVVVWGLTYKPGTNTLRRSLAVDLCNWLIAQGAAVRVHDPKAQGLPGSWTRSVTRFDDPVSALNGAQALVIGAEWPEYKQIPGESVAKSAPELIVLDPNRFLGALATAPAVRYFAVGTPAR